MNIEKLNTTAEFSEKVAEFQAMPNYRNPLGFGIFKAQYGQVNEDKIITGKYLTLNWGNNFGSAAVMMAASGMLHETEKSTAATVEMDLNPTALDNMVNLFAPYFEEATGSAHQNVQAVKALRELQRENGDSTLSNYKLVFIYEDTDIQSLPEAYLKLGAFSICKAKPGTLNLSGMFGTLTTVGWPKQNDFNSPMAYELEYLEAERIKGLVMNSEIDIEYVDKFPRYLDMVLPQKGVRILDTAKVRYGAYIDEDSTVMPGASYINFNAGVGKGCMVEGRVSSAAFVADKSDVGGGASMLGTLSGGNSTPIYVGKSCLLGANSALGIALGDACTLASGVSIMPGSKVFVSSAEWEKLAKVNGDSMPDVENDPFTGAIFKAEQLSGLNGLLIFNSAGIEEANLEVRLNTKVIEMNPELHG